MMGVGTAAFTAHSIPYREWGDGFGWTVAPWLPLDPACFNSEGMAYWDTWAVRSRIPSPDKRQGSG